MNKLDLSTATVLAAGPPRRAIRKTGEPVVNLDGEPLHDLKLVVFDDDDAVIYRVRTPSVDEAIVAKSPLLVAKLLFSERTSERGSWVSYEATAVGLVSSAPSRPARSDAS